MHAVFHRFEGWLTGWPDDLLSLALILAALLLVWIALRGDTLAKVTALAYVVLP